MKSLLKLVLVLFALTAPVTCIVKNIQFNQQCSGYLKQAADANTPELALERLNLAIQYAEQHNLTEGYTSILWKTEDENIGFWYRNLCACQKELENCLDQSQLDKSNVLIKVRESLTDQGEKGTVLTVPDGISRYPNNLLWAATNWVSVILLLVVILWIVYDSEN